MSVPIKLDENYRYIPCPKCGNNTIFTCISNQFAEDCCNVYVVCQCGYDPTSENTSYRYEDVWGGVNHDTVSMALECWNEAIAALREKEVTT